MKYLLLFDTPSPWREKVFEKVHNYFGNDFHVAYYCRIEKIRLWKFVHGKHPKTFLKSISINIKNRGEKFINPGIFIFLLRHRPKIAIIFGLYPTSFISTFIIKLLGGKVILLSDSWLGKDVKTSFDQKLARKLIYNHMADAYIGASRQTLNMFRHYNHEIDENSLFLSALCADNDYFKKFLQGKIINRNFDLIFSGRIVDMKNLIFVAKVATRIKLIMGSCDLLIIETEMKQ